MKTIFFLKLAGVIAITSMFVQAYSDFNEENIQLIKIDETNKSNYVIINKSNYLAKISVPSSLKCSSNTVMAGQKIECSSENVILPLPSMINVYNDKEVRSLKVTNGSFEDGSYEGWDGNSNIEIVHSEYKGQDGLLSAEIVPNNKEQETLSKDIKIDKVSIYKIKILAAIRNTINSIEAFSVLTLHYLDKEKNIIESVVSHKIVSNQLTSGLKEYVLMLPKVATAKYIQFTARTKDAILSIDHFRLSSIKQSTKLVHMKKKMNSFSALDTERKAFYGFANSCIGNFVWNDKNKNGIQDKGEKGIGGVVVNLYDRFKKSKLRSVTTKANGSYIFSKLCGQAGYYVKVQIPVNWRATKVRTGFPMRVHVDSNLENSGWSDYIQLANNQYLDCFDFGLYSVAKPSIDIEKFTNNVQADTGKGPIVNVGSKITWKYWVKNTGNTILKNIVVKDNKEGAIKCPTTVLKPGKAMNCYKYGKAKASQYANIGIVIAVSPENKKVTDRDASHYYGTIPPKPSIDIEKFTNNVQADTGKGPIVNVGSKITWKYWVKNTGNTILKNIVVKDNKEGAIKCPTTVLKPGKAMNCYKYGKAKTGQYSNIGTVIAISPENKQVTDSDTSHYYVIPLRPSIDIEKFTNNIQADKGKGPIVRIGAKITWKYWVKNTGNMVLKNIIVLDNKEGAIKCPTTVLNPGQEMDCYKYGKARQGGYENIGIVTAVAQGNKQVTDRDVSHYHGEKGHGFIK